MVKLFQSTDSRIDTRRDRRIDRRFALSLFAMSLGLYLRTLAPGLLAGDAGEFQVAAWRLGLAHPTGYPLYLILGSLWQHLLALVGLSPAYALNALSALFGAATVTLLFLGMLRWLQSPLAVRRPAALFTATLFAVNFTFWSQNLIAEVYTLHVLFVVLIFLVANQLLVSVTSKRMDEDQRRAQGAAGEDVHSIPASFPPHLVPLRMNSLVILSSCQRSAETSASSVEPRSRRSLVLLLSFLVGLALTHHAMTLLLLPGLALVLWQARGRWMLSLRCWLPALVAMVAPLLLYLYIPLRSGPAASPWYHQPLGDAPLTLYQNTWPAFINFVTGQSISIGFHTVSEALQQLPQAWLLWRLHLLWPGVVLALLGLYVLVRQRNWPLLALTVPFFLLQQLFNLFYAIGDILVYYIPLYLIAAIWAGFAADAIGGGVQALMHKNGSTPDQTTPESATGADLPRPTFPAGIALVLLLFWLPMQLVGRDFAQIDQSNATQAQQMWQAIAAAEPPADAILVSNDRNEIVPLFYLQVVTGQMQGVTGLFPRIAPEARFADIGATVESALDRGNGRPVYLIKPMPGLETKFALAEATPPLVQVMIPAAATAPTTTVDQPFGPLRLLGYDWHPSPDGVQITLYWQVQERLPADYTTTVQLFDANREKLAQDDVAPGGVYYPTSLWKPGETLVERHTLALGENQQPVTMLVGMYLANDLTSLAPAVEISLPKAASNQENDML